MNRLQIWGLAVGLFLAGSATGALSTMVWADRAIAAGDAACNAKISLAWTQAEQGAKGDVDDVRDKLIDALRKQVEDQDAENEDLRSRLTTETAGHESLVNALKSMEESETVIYRLETPGLPLLNGAITVSPGSQAHPVGTEQPEWVLPLRIRPTCVRCGANAQFAWINKTTHQIEGPYRVQ